MLGANNADLSSNHSQTSFFATFFSFLKGFYSSVGIVCCIGWLTLDKDIPFGFEMLVVVAAVGGVVVVVVAVGLSN